METFNRVGKADEKLINFQHLPSLVDVGAQRVHCVSTVVQLVNGEMVKRSFTCK